MPRKEKAREVEATPEGRRALPRVVSDRLLVALRQVYDLELATKPRGAVSRIARELGVSQPRATQLLAKDTNERPSYETAREIARLARLNLDDLLEADAIERARGPLANLDLCLEYHGTSTWSPWTVAAAREGLWSGDTHPANWKERLDALEEVLRRASRTIP